MTATETWPRPVGWGVEGEGGVGFLDGPVPVIPLLAVPDDVVTDIADLAVAGRYIPVGIGPEPIAGDFYDLLRLDDDVVAIIVGDVAGHGGAATARMQQLRAATRAYALDQLGPGRLIAKLDLFCSRLDPESIATLWYAEYRASTGMLTYASAGHPPPVLTAHDGPPTLLEVTTAPPLGVGVAGEVGEVEVHELILRPGAILIAYSDGLIERRGTDFDDQLELLTGIVRHACDPAHHDSADDIAAEILDALVPQPDQAEDDVCLLVVRRQPPAAPAVLSPL